jgi:polyether ionophore transport system permease protein
VRPAELVGTGPLARLVLRRDRLLLAGWVLAMGLLAVGFAAGSATAYPSEADRIAVVADTAANPALLVLRGPVFAPTPGALVAQGFASSGVLLGGLASLLLVVRSTRLDEQTGRRELLGSTVVGRHAPLAAALVVVAAGNLAVAVVVAAGLLALGLPAAGAVALGLVLAAGGIVFAAVGAVAAQLTEGAGAARALGGAGVAAALLVAGVGDLARSWSVWLSPLGWARHLRSFAGERWWVLALFAALAAGLLAVAFALSARRDTGAGLIPARRGPAAAGPALRGPSTLAWRVHRGSVLAWTVGAGVLGAALGTALSSAAGLFDTPAYRELAATLGGGDVATAYFRLVLYVLAQVVAAFAAATALRVPAQETGGLADLLLSGPVGRTRWALGHLAVAAVGTAAVLAGLGLGAAIGRGDPAVLPTTLAYLPACLVFAGLATALTGWAPRLAVPLTWTLLGLSLLVDFLGEFGVLDLAVLQRLSPFVATSVPLETGSGLAAVLVALVVIAAGAAALGLRGLRRRDLRTR